VCSGLGYARLLTEREATIQQLELLSSLVSPALATQVQFLIRWLVTAFITAFVRLLIIYLLSNCFFAAIQIFCLL